jgi:hypothetical protein
MPAPRSLWREAVAARAAPQAVQDYLIDEANLRGFWGAFRNETPDRLLDPKLSLEDLVVGLLSPHAPAEARVFKLVLRILQSPRLDHARLLLRARREAAMPTLYWLLMQVPPEEINAPLRGLIDVARVPRGYRPMSYRYDPSRLIRRPARKGDLWRKLQKSS